MGVMPGSASEASDYRKRTWNKDRKPWEGEVGTVEVLRRAMWKSVYGLGTEGDGVMPPLRFDPRRYWSRWKL
jgi:hypothetical protein